MKVAWFGHAAGAKRNGIVTYSRETVRGLLERECEVLFFYHAAREKLVLPPPNVHAIRIGALDILNRAVVSSLRAERTIRHAFEREQPDVAHVSLSFSNLDGSLPDLCHDAGIPIVATLHIPYGPPGSFWGNAAKLLYWVNSGMLSKYDAVIVFSHNQRAMLAEYGVDPERIQVIPNGVDVVKYSPGARDYQQEIGARLVISYVGRVDPEKNVNVLLEAFDELSLPADHHLVIVGDGVDLGRLRRKYSSNRRIHFRGFVRDELERVRVLRSTDIFVLPSAIEGLSLSMLEGMASGAAVIATDVGSDGEALQGAGIVLDQARAEAQLPLALRALIDFPEFRRRLGELARARAIEQYSLRNNLDQVVHLYQNLRTSKITTKWNGTAIQSKIKQRIAIPYGEMQENPGEPIE
ncbi:MAG: glycosyltransferase family 4 protein [Anaerolineae bacterium]